jgi:hypothetical protein
MSASSRGTRESGQQSWLGLRPGTLLLLVAIAVLLVTVHWRRTPHELR